MKNICIICSRYPTVVDKTALTFVQQLAWAMADAGNNISVICPLPVNININFLKVADEIIEHTYKGNTIKVYHPKYISFGQRKILNGNTAVFTTFLFEKVVDSVLKKMKSIPDILYGHFITPSGITACKLAQKYHKYSFIAYGESSTWSIEHYGVSRVKKILRNVTGIISVSSKNKKDLIELEICDEEKISVIPNSYMPERFSPQNQSEERKKMGIDNNKFVVSFVGHFIERKGISILCKAIESIPDVYLICAGKGPQKPFGEKVLYADLINPDELAGFYSASDIFVLPTLNEGCCNAIIEAMACGLPIVSSNLEFNRDLLKNTNSILVDPLDVEAIKTAILELKNDKEKRNKMKRASLEIASNLTLEMRAQKIVLFIDKQISV